MEHNEKPFDLMAAIQEGQCFTRDGHEVAIVCVMCDGSTYPIQGVLNDDGVLRQCCWTLGGRYVRAEAFNHLNLLNEKPEGDDED